MAAAMIVQDDGIDWALQQISEPKSNSVGRAVDILLHATSDGIDSTLFEVVRNVDRNFEAAALASRILVERDPNRDPDFLVNLFSPASNSRRLPDKMYGRFETFMVGDHSFAALFYQFGFARLRQLDPIAQYADLVTHRFTTVRLSAAIALGDTGDLAALDVLTLALRDRKASVRKQAADAVRRLRHAGASDVIGMHPVRGGLLKLLNDRKRAVWIAAARALGELDADALRNHRAEVSIFSWRRRVGIDEVLEGKIPPLVQLWPGDKSAS